MKALSLTQPWATLVAIGAKRFETRSWGTNYRGPLAIHAAKGFPKDCALLCVEEPFHSALRRAGITGADALSRGFILATCELTECLRTEMVIPLIRGTDEEKFGDYGDRRYAFKLENLQLLTIPIPAKGALGLWEWVNDCPHVGCQRPMPHEHTIEGPVQARAELTQPKGRI